MEIRGKFWIVLGALGAAMPASAQWQLIDDFQQWEADSYFYEATDIGWHALNEPGYDEYWILKDPQDSDNNGLYVESGGYDVSYSNTWVVKELPGDGIPPGSTATLFFRCLWEDIVNSWIIGTADKPLELDPITGVQTAPGAYGDYNAMFTLLYGQGEPFEYRDGDSYVPTDPPLYPEIGLWYDFWMVLENSWDYSTQPPTSTGRYTMYIQGPGFGDGVSPVLIPVGTDPPKDAAAFRRAPAEEDGTPRSIIWLMFFTNSPLGYSSSSDSIFLLDDFYFSQGENLSNPLDSWIGFTIDPSGDVDTGDWLGWLNVSKAPYIWSYSLNGWIYMEEPSTDAPGAWGYFFK